MRMMKKKKKRKVKSKMWSSLFTAGAVLYSRPEMQEEFIWAKHHCLILRGLGGTMGVRIPLDSVLAVLGYQ